jgi:hypothetical protein
MQEMMYGERREREGRAKEKKKKKEKRGALPDPQYLMMLKMMDPDIDMTGIIENAMGVKPKKKRRARDGSADESSEEAVVSRRGRDKKQGKEATDYERVRESGANGRCSRIKIK